MNFLCAAMIYFGLIFLSFSVDGVTKAIEQQKCEVTK